MLLLLTSEEVDEDMVVEFQNGILQMLHTFSSSGSGLTLPKPPAIVLWMLQYSGDQLLFIQLHPVLFIKQWGNKMITSLSLLNEDIMTQEPAGQNVPEEIGRV